MKTQSTVVRERKLHFKNTEIPLHGSAHALNFVNTLTKRGSENPKDYLTNYEAFLYWCNKAGVIDYDHYQTISLEAYCYAHETKGIFDEMIKTRFMLYEIFLSVIEQRPADEIFVRQFNLVLDSASKHFRYISAPGGLQLVWLNIDEQIALPLWMVARAAAELLTKGDPKRIKRCKTCGCMFFDRTKNGARQWCNPSICGRQINEKRHYHAKKGIKAGMDNVPV
jgi:predicted RNA-binding Zn ribbon-like protein